MSEFLNSIQAFIDDIKGEKAWVEEFNEHSRNIVQQLKAASRDEANEPCGGSRHVSECSACWDWIGLAFTCGSLADLQRGDPAIGGPSLLDTVPVINGTAGDFRGEPRTSPLPTHYSSMSFVQSLPTAQTMPRKEELTPAGIIENYITSEGWRGCRQIRAVLFRSIQLRYWDTCPNIFFARH